MPAEAKALKTTPVSSRPVGEHVDGSRLRVVERREVVVGDSVRLQDRSKEVVEASAGGADDDSLALHVRQGADAG